VRYLARNTGTGEVRPVYCIVCERLSQGSAARSARSRASARLSVSLGRETAALGNQCLIFGIGLRSICLESRISDLPISLLARSDRIGLSFSAPLRYIDTVDASTI